MHKGKNGILELLEDNSLLMTQALFYEILYSEEEEMKRCFSNLPACRNPFVLLVRYIDVLRYEMTEKRDWRYCDKLCEQYPYDFTEFKKPNFHLDQEFKKILSVNDNGFNKHAEYIKLCVKLLRDTFPELNNFKSGKNPNTLENVKERFISDHEFILYIYNNTFQAIKNNFKVCTIPVINKNWAYFLYIQIYFLLLLDLFPKLDNIDKINIEKIKNENFDCDYLFFACLFGSLASFDKHMRDKFKRLKPEGILFPENM